MANPLLEFVLSLVRDPEAAARYAANPEQAIAEAHLADVTRLDVNSLIPVVSESISAGGVEDNVWTSGQAVAAFDAFGDELPGLADRAVDGPIGDGPVIEAPTVDAPDPSPEPGPEPDLVAPDPVFGEASVGEDWAETAADSGIGALGDLGDPGDLPDSPSDLDVFGQ
ncbi:MAG: Rv0340 family IniB-related protein [Actinomycetota bacterium]|nr:Rv0340 family IniB-related protein [Actinomycetota bacterium]